MKRMNLMRNSQVDYDTVIKDWASKEHFDVFRDHFLINFVTNTNQIENINIDYNTTRELFESETLTSYTGDLRDIFSVLNNRRVADYLNSCISAKQPITSELIRETHRLLMFGSMDRHRYEDNGERAGTFKQKDYCVGKMSVGSLPEDVAEDIEDLCKLLEEIGSKDPLKIASVFQCHFEYIHPFADGNGRVGRWLTNYILVKNNHPPILFCRESRPEYYRALEDFDINEDYTFMYEYLKNQVVKSYSALRGI